MVISVSKNVTAASDAKKLADSIVESISDELFRIIEEKGITVKIAECALDRARILVHTRTIVGHQSSESVISMPESITP